MATSLLLFCRLLAAQDSARFIQESKILNGRKSRTGRVLILILCKSLWTGSMSLD